jgi:hypothetical protein
MTSLPGLRPVWVSTVPSSLTSSGDDAEGRLNLDGKLGWPVLDRSYTWRHTLKAPSLVSSCQSSA